MKKVCSKCGIEKDLIEGFYVHKGKTDGRYSACKTCHNAATKAWTKANPKAAGMVLTISAWLVLPAICPRVIGHYWNGNYHWQRGRRHAHYHPNL